MDTDSDPKSRGPHLWDSPPDNPVQVAEAELSPRLSDRAANWASTMSGHQGKGAIRFAHADQRIGTEPARRLDREAREKIERHTLTGGATLALGAGHRVTPEEPDDMRTCFERDRDRILHSTAFRRLAGKTQVFVFPEDHQRTRLTHALEVAQVAVAVARASRLNVALTEAIALAHDCGHGPGGHASEDALTPFLPEGFDHALWGADVVLTSLNLTREVLDGVRNHSWSRPAPSTPEGEVVSWADRCAYSAHDLEDAVSAGIVSTKHLPALVVDGCGSRRSEQLRTFIGGLVETISTTGQVGMDSGLADALAGLRQFNYEHIYLRESSRQQADAVISVLRALVEYYAEHPHLLPDVPVTEISGSMISESLRAEVGSQDAVRAAVTYVGGMTDRYACQMAVTHLGWDPDQLPKGVGTER